MFLLCWEEDMAVGHSTRKILNAHSRFKGSGPNLSGMNIYYPCPSVLPPGDAVFYFRNCTWGSRDPLQPCCSLWQLQPPDFWVSQAAKDLLRRSSTIRTVMVSPDPQRTLPLAGLTRRKEPVPNFLEELVALSPAPSSSLPHGVCCRFLVSFPVLMSISTQGRSPLNLFISSMIAPAMPAFQPHLAWILTFSVLLGDTPVVSLNHLLCSLQGIRSYIPRDCSHIEKLNFYPTLQTSSLDQALAESSSMWIFPAPANPCWLDFAASWGHNHFPPLSGLASSGCALTLTIRLVARRESEGTHCLVEKKFCIISKQEVRRLSIGKADQFCRQIWGSKILVASI